ncbi:hypothetical protein Maes01_00815 [Microbulbifer aestuariivivens]|uniref:Uncharacterized protein n=1 Tax=Microbulbifer aestuariivivens TaxID=1908308 RepID=A0ABP9WQ83_9GAMM
MVEVTVRVAGVGSELVFLQVSDSITVLIAMGVGGIELMEIIFCLVAVRHAITVRIEAVAAV